MPINSAIPVVVTSTGWTWGAIFGAIQAVIALLLGGGGFVALVRVWPRLKELAIGERRGDLEDMRERITQLESKVDEANRAAHSAELKLIYAVSAVQLLMGRLQTESPDDPALKQARELLAAATTGGMPGFAGAFMEGLHKVRGVKE